MFHLCPLMPASFLSAIHMCRLFTPSHAASLSLSFFLGSGQDGIYSSISLNIYIPQQRRLVNRAKQWMINIKSRSGGGLGGRQREHYVTMAFIQVKTVSVWTGPEIIYNGICIYPSKCVCLQNSGLQSDKDKNQYKCDYNDTMMSLSLHSLSDCLNSLCHTDVHNQG